MAHLATPHFPQHPLHLLPAQGATAIRVVLVEDLVEFPPEVALVGCVGLLFLDGRVGAGDDRPVLVLVVGVRLSVLLVLGVAAAHGVVIENQIIITETKSLSVHA